MCEAMEKLMKPELDKKYADGAQNEKVNSIRAVMDSLKISMDAAMDILKVSASERPILEAKLKQ